jgi:hypothetical protein
MDGQQEVVEKEKNLARGQERVLMFSTTFTSGVPGYLLEERDGLFGWNKFV